MRRGLWFGLSLLAGLCCHEPAKAAAWLGNQVNGRPSCSDEGMIQAVLQKIQEYNQAESLNSIREVRRRDLLVKNLRSFVPVVPDNFTDKDDFHTANRLITLKINQGMEDSDFTLCKSAGTGEDYNIYLLIYRPENQAAVTVEIINFLPPEKSGEVFATTLHVEP